MNTACTNTDWKQDRPNSTLPPLPILHLYVFLRSERNPQGILIWRTPDDACLHNMLHSPLSPDHTTCHRVKLFAHHRAAIFLFLAYKRQWEIPYTADTHRLCRRKEVGDRLAEALHDDLCTALRSTGLAYCSSANRFSDRPSKP